MSVTHHAYNSRCVLLPMCATIYMCHSQDVLYPMFATLDVSYFPYLILPRVLHLKSVGLVTARPISKSLVVNSLLLYPPYALGDSALGARKPPIHPS